LQLLHENNNLFVICRLNRNVLSRKIARGRLRLAFASFSLPHHRRRRVSGQASCSSAIYHVLLCRANWTLITFLHLRSARSQWMRESTPVRGRIRCESSVSPEHSLPQQIDYSECALPSPLSSPHIIESAGERVGVMFAVVPYQSSSGLATKTASAMNIIRVDPLDAAADRILEG
jgi:hypothetical protein